ncbi:hypothetical protein BJY01DRAFT_245205 [Aspergillus pseudoustus]|uniref:Uncharacterized protein n=1 Tax=Aspergillus pseudoustus TaxID=1810923 RepID=A0ABR4KFR4_9EURO
MSHMFGKPSFWFKLFVSVTRGCTALMLIVLGAFGIHSFIFVKWNSNYLTAPPFSLSPGTVLLVDGFTGPLAIVLVGVNIVSLVIVMVCAYRRMLVYLGSLDLLCCTGLLWAGVIQSTYVGLTKAQCAKGTGSDGETLLFIQRAREVTTEFQLWGWDPCDVYLQAFYFRAVALLFYVPTALTFIIKGALDMRMDRMHKRGGPHIPIVRWFFFLPVIIAYYVAVDLARFVGCWYLSGKARTPEFQLQARRWRALRKWVSIKATVLLTCPNPAQVLWGAHRRFRRHRNSGVSWALIAALGQEPVVNGIARHVHHVDLVNLSLACRPLRRVLFPVLDTCVLRESLCDIPRSEEELVKESKPMKRGPRLIVLDPPSDPRASLNCWGCGIRICRNCSTTRRLCETHVSFHAEFCGAQCGRCFAAEWIEIRQCKCKDRRRRFLNDMMHPVHLCRGCDKESDETLQAWRESRDRRAHHRAVHESLSCFTCKESIQDANPIWWACQICRYECRSLEHPWGRGVDV